jgi:RHS repeat-associated protein
MLLYELKPNGTAVYYVYLNGKQIAKVEGSKKYFYHTDHLGSTRAITDEQGKVTGRFEYQPYGLEENTVAGDDTLTFTGKIQDAPTGLMYFNARYYDPTLGRFITEDPAKDRGNWYIYCGNGPLKYIDPTGESYILVILPQDRSQKGILILLSQASKDKAKINLAFDVLGKGDGQDRTKRNADTPLGIYEFTGFLSGGKVRSYGPGQRVGMAPVGGEALDIENAGTREVSTIRIHGGDLTAKNDLRPTYGCIRATNEHMEILINELKYLDSIGDELEYIYVIQGVEEAITETRGALQTQNVFLEPK